MNKKELKKFSITKEKNKLETLIFIPIMLVLGLVPLIVRLKIQTAVGQDISYALGTQHTDLFSYWKAATILIIAMIMIGVSFFLFKVRDLKASKVIKLSSIAIGIFLLLTIISGAMSEYKSLVWWGQYGQREGVIVLTSYAIIGLYSLYFYKKQSDVRYILIPLSFVVVIEGLFVFSQFMGNDILFLDFMKDFIIPAEYQISGSSMTLALEGKAYGTLLNPNYLGSFVSLLLPIFIAVSLGVVSLKHKLLSITLGILLIFILFASGSRAGIIGMVCSILAGIILLKKIYFRNYKNLLILGVTCIALYFGVDMATGGLVSERTNSVVKETFAIFEKSEESILDNAMVKDIYVVDDKLSIELEGEKKLNLIVYNGDEFAITDENDILIEYTIEDEKYIIPKVTLPVSIRFQVGSINYENTSNSLYVLEVDEKRWFMTTLVDGNLITLDGYGNPISIEKAEYIGFEGKEKIGSNRGYIWSRSLPILRDNIIFGVGADAFVAKFPHGDIVARNAVYDSPNIIVSKPHNLYLQIGINQGIFALAAFLVLNGTYIVNSFRVYRKKTEYTFHDMFGIGIMLGIVGYLGAGMFNDSVVSVAPLYWCLLGIGLAVNYVNSGDNLQG